MTDPVQLRHGFVRIKLGAALRGLGPDTNSFGSVLDVDQVNLDQPGLNESDAKVCVAGCSNMFHGEGVPARLLSRPTCLQPRCRMLPVVI